MKDGSKIVFQVDYSHAGNGTLIAGPPVCKMKKGKPIFFVLSHLLLASPFLALPCYFFLRSLSYGEHLLLSYLYDGQYLDLCFLPLLKLNTYCWPFSWLSCWKISQWADFPKDVSFLGYLNLVIFYSYLNFDKGFLERQNFKLRWKKCLMVNFQLG